VRAGIGGCGGYTTATATATAAAAAAAAGAAVLRAAPWISMTAAHRPQIPATVSQ